MKAELWVRAGFYLVEAALLSVPLIGGLLLAGSAVRRHGVAFPPLTSFRMIAILLGLAAFDAALGEFLGPHVIVQYYGAALILTGGACSWALTLVVTTLAARRRAP